MTGGGVFPEILQVVDKLQEHPIAEQLVHGGPVQRPPHQKTIRQHGSSPFFNRPRKETAFIPGSGDPMEEEAVLLSAMDGNQALMDQWEPGAGILLGDHAEEPGHFSRMRVRSDGGESLQPEGQPMEKGLFCPGGLSECVQPVVCIRIEEAVRK